MQGKAAPAPAGKKAGIKAGTKAGTKAAGRGKPGHKETRSGQHASHERVQPAQMMAGFMLQQEYDVAFD